MKNRVVILIFIVLSNTIFSQTSFFIKYKESVSPARIKNIIDQKVISAKSSLTLNKISGVSISHFAKSLGISNDFLSRIVKVTTTANLTADDLNNIQTSSAEIEYVQIAHKYKIDIVPNDQFISEQWALDAIKAFDAWNITEGNDSVIVGIIDTGIDYLHPDLKNNIFVNSSEDINHNGILDAGDLNGIDDDGNGFIDDVIGWDFTDRQGFPFDSTGGDYLTWDNNPADENGHGTNVAGIIAAESNNRIGISGIAPKIKILNLRAFDPTGNGEEDDVAAAILYAVKMKVKVINMSFGDDSFSMVLRDVIKYAYSQNITLVGSSGNSSSELPHYPSSYSEVISVGASTKEDYVASFSNTGSTIDLVAPGVGIYTTTLNNAYTSINGTSAAAPFVSGVAALILSMKIFSPEEVKQIIKSTSDDITPAGWDLQSAAGRLNLFNALNVIAPASIRIISPLQDFATDKDTLSITASVLSPYFVSYNLYYGKGYNPAKWTSLLIDQKNQFSSKEIYSLNLSGLSDTVYTLRLIVELINGRTTEERVNFYIDHTPPKLSVISVSPAYYGEKSTILAQISTDDLSSVRMYYRPKGTTEFSFISLDGFTTNNEFMKRFHYGFIPKDLIVSGTDYDIYFEGINLAGLSSILLDSNKYFSINTDSYLNLVAEYEQPFTLSSGRIFKDPVNFTNSNYKEIMLLDNNNSPNPLKFYKFENDKFIKIDSMKLRIVKDFGDFNSDGKWDLLSSLNRTGYIDDQISPGSTKLENKYIDTSGSFFPILAKDIDNDGYTEILSIMKDKTLAIWQVNSNLGLSLEDTLNNFSPKDPTNQFSNNFALSNAALADNNNDGKNEIWMVDQDGDIMSFLINGKDNYSDGIVIPTDYQSDNSIIAVGDYNGDGTKEVGVLLHSNNNFSIAPLNLLMVFNTLNNNLNIIYEKLFLDPSSEFRSAYQSAESSLRFVDIDNNSKEEIVLFTFPYSYIIKNDGISNSILSYKENINSSSVFTADLNSNGVKEIAYPTANGIKFYEFAIPQKPNTPAEVTGYSLDSLTVYLSWKGKSSRYYIYRSTNQSNVELIDSTSSLEYIDRNVTQHKTYFYQFIASDPLKLINYSDRSSLISVYVHQPAKIIQVDEHSTNSILVTFNERINPTVENLLSFEVVGKGVPNSVTAASQYSYLISFNTVLTGENLLVIQGLKDLFNSPILSDTIKFLVSPSSIRDEFYITSFKLLSGNKIQVNFNLPVDENSIQNTGNYYFEPLNKAVNIGVNDNKSSIEITSEYPVGSIGREYKLKIENIFSSVSTGSIKINKEAGSYIVLSSYSQNLDNVFVYPNPVRIDRDGQKLTFANLTKNTSIIIFNLNGKKIKSLVENNGDGGISWDLKDENGELVSSGIYIYRAAALDENNNESQVKLEKFAILK
jgi:subtilisin family serine protease